MDESTLPSDEALRVRLGFSGSSLTPGLSDEEIAKVEQTFGFHFPA